MKIGLVNPKNNNSIIVRAGSVFLASSILLSVNFVKADTWRTYGNTTYGPSGTYRQYGNTLYGPQGTYRQYGNTIYGP